MVTYQTCLIRRVGRLSVESADNYEESANGNIPTGASVLELADSELESADSSADSNADASKVGVWVGPLVRDFFLF